MEKTMMDRIKSTCCQSYAIGDFVEWLSKTKGAQIMVCAREEFVPSPLSTQQLLDEYFGIDRVEAEREQRIISEEFKSGKRRLSYNPRRA